MSHAQQMLWIYGFMAVLYAVGMATFGAAVFMERRHVHEKLRMTGWRLRLTITLVILLWWIPALMMMHSDFRRARQWWRTRNSRSNVDA